MSGEPRTGPGLGDLENELTCSICTELLYQPLTLLDCLHTFCGSCLREWFFVQGSRRRRPSSSPKFTCPSCRAGVRETRPNATVTTLLDIVLAANPDRNRSPEEKEEIAQKYKPGDAVFPPGDTDSDEDDHRVVDHVRQLSLQESRSRTRETRHRAPHSSSRARHAEHDTRRDEGRTRRRREEERSGRRQGHDRGTRRDEAVEHTRRIEHQSSLRSLLSLSDPETMEEEILRQILDEGLLNDIDMDNLGPRQEEELSERIADAYRRRHRLRSEPRESSHRTTTRPRARSHSVQRPTAGPPLRESSRPPASRPYLFEPLVSRPGPSTHQRRLSEQGNDRRRTSPTPAHQPSSSETTLRSNARSSSDMTSERSRAPQTATRPEPSTTRRRRATESEQVPHLWTPGTRERAPQVVAGRPLTDSPTVASPQSPMAPGSAVLPVSTSLAPNVNGSVQNGRSRPSSSRSNVSHSAPSYTEPLIPCDRCGKNNIQYELHKRCPYCKNGNYHLCFRCYRAGRGCLHWSGFGPSAQASFERILAMANNGQPTTPVPNPPHILVSSQYKRTSSTRRATNDDRQMTSDDPARRLQTGLFCDICSSETNDCFWKCDQCNEGDWGFCNHCVNQGRCCTHPLLPICRFSSTSETDTPSSTDETFKILSISTNCDVCTSSIPASTTRFHCLTCNAGDYDVCANCYLKLGAMGKISKENGHNGWRRCLRGHRMVVVGFEDYEEGQRRVVVRDLVGGRALKDEHVNSPLTSHVSAVPGAPTPGTGTIPEVGTGDWSWKEGTERRKKASRARTPWPNTPHSRNTFLETPPQTPTTLLTAATLTTPTITSTSPTTQTTPHTQTRRFPPDGGVGVIAQALWSWYPEDGVVDELMFPRGAEITEAENINDDWFWGCYAGATGLFPGMHVRVLAEVA